eukprot:5143521-Pleurochrysis_carterae.AAC.1
MPQSTRRSRERSTPSRLCKTSDPPSPASCLAASRQALRSLHQRTLQHRGESAVRRRTGKAVFVPVRRNSSLSACLFLHRESKLSKGPRPSFFVKCYSDIAMFDAARVVGASQTLCACVDAPACLPIHSQAYDQFAHVKAAPRTRCSCVALIRCSCVALNRPRAECSREAHSYALSIRSSRLSSSWRMDPLVWDRLLY